MRGAKHLKLVSIVAVILLVCSDRLPGLANSQKETPRSIISDDFTKHRPRPRTRAKSKPRRSTYRLVSKPIARPFDKFGDDPLQFGVTIWKLQRVRAGANHAAQLQWIARRVSADTQFHAGEYLRLSFESPRPGYLYVVNRDWFADGSSGRTNLIFPLRGEDNRLQAGKLIDIPAENQLPFQASPELNQAGELLTIIITSEPLRLPLSDRHLPISSTQLAEWEEMWGGPFERFEMNGGAGKARTMVEQLAASRRRSRQLTRDDPAPQTIYFLSPKNSDGLLFSLLLSYVK